MVGKEREMVVETLGSVQISLSKAVRNKNNMLRHEYSILEQKSRIPSASSEGAHFYCNCLYMR